MSSRMELQKSTAGFWLFRSAIAVALICIVTAVAGCNASTPKPASTKSPREQPAPQISPSGSLEPGHHATPATTDADFDADGFSDLAVAGGLQNVKDVDDGVVVVVYGSAAGLNPGRSQGWSETDFDGPATRSFGEAITIGDFDGDGFSDLAIGSPDAPVDSAKEHAGNVRIIYGSLRGLAKARSQLWSQNSPGIAGHAEPNDGFGVALVAANFGFGPQDDLGIGVHGENQDEGAVNVIYGSTTGLSSGHSQIWSQATRGIAGAAEQYDAFGWTLSAGRFRPVGFADLAVGVTSDRVGHVWGAGAVNIISGSAAGLTARGSRRWTQDSPGIIGRSESGDAFGHSMAAGRFTGGQTDDLAIGTPFENGNRGAVNVIHGSARGLSPNGNQIWSQASSGLAGKPESDDTFGWSLAAGSFGQDQHGRVVADLAIRVPGELTTSSEEGGAISVIYGTPHGLTARGSQTLTRGVNIEIIGIDVSWRRQLTAVRAGQRGTRRPCDRQRRLGLRHRRVRRRNRHHTAAEMDRHDPRTTRSGVRSR